MSGASFSAAYYESEIKMQNMKTGVVKFWNGKKGFGFIKPDEGGDDMFVHVTALEKAGMGTSLEEGDHVQFDTQTDKRSGKAKVDNIAWV